MLNCQKCRIGKFGAFSFLLDTLEFFFFHASCYTYLLGFKNNGRPVWTRAGILDHLSTAKMSKLILLCPSQKGKKPEPQKTKFETSFITNCFSIKYLSDDCNIIVDV